MLLVGLFFASSEWIRHHVLKHFSRLSYIDGGYVTTENYMDEESARTLNVLDVDVKRVELKTITGT